MHKINLSPFPELETAGYILRQLRNSDENEIFILRSDPGVMEYLDHPKAESLDDARAFIARINKGIENNHSIYWAVCRKGDTQLLGTICLWNISEDPFKADIGFELLPDFQGKGVMHEVIPEVLKYGFNTIGFEEIIGETAPGNIKSIKILERFGFKFSGKNENFLTFSIKRSAD